MTDTFKAPARRLGKLDRPGCQIHYEVTGSGPVIVFAHGLGGNHLSWWQQVGHFSSRFTCITFAHRGFAPSSPLSGGPDPSDYADDLAALVDHLEIKEFRLVAQSMGGWTSVEYALKRTGKLKALVLAATTGSLDPRQMREPERSRLVDWQQKAQTTLADYVAKGIHPAAGALMASEQPALHLLYRHIDDMNAGLDKEGIRSRLGANRTRAPEELGAAGCPILFISGDLDLVIPPFAADAMAAVLPNARVVHIPNAAHSAYFERASVFNKLVDDFFAG